MNRIFVSVVFLVVFQAQLCRSATINVANGKPVIGGNGDHFAGNYNTSASFATNNVTDGQNAADPLNNSGAITEPGQDGSYWLGRNGVSTGYFVLDLGTPQAIHRFELFNTRNYGYNDRGTGQFTIKGSNSITNLSVALGDDIVGGTLLASGTLTSQTYAGPSNTLTPILDTLVMDNFLSLDNVNSYRYLRFDALSIGAALNKGFPNAAGVGLNELRAIVPEPSGLALLLLGITGLLSRRRF